MTPERIRIKVAEAMGWKHPEYGYMQNAWRESNGSWHFGSNVLDDLNACAEFEGTLTTEERHDYVRTLCSIMCGWHSMPGFVTTFATALQRCEAYLRVKGLWEESPIPDKQPLSPHPVR